MHDPELSILHRILARAREEAARRGHLLVGTLHLVWALLEGPEGPAVAELKHRGVTRERIDRELQLIDEPAAHDPLDISLPLTPRARAALRGAHLAQRKMGREPVAPEHLLLALFQDGCGLALCELLGATSPADLRGAVLGRMGAEQKDLVLGLRESVPIPPAGQSSGAAPAAPIELRRALTPLLIEKGIITAADLRRKAEEIANQGRRSEMLQTEPAPPAAGEDDRRARPGKQPSAGTTQEGEPPAGNSGTLPHGGWLDLTAMAAEDLLGPVAGRDVEVSRVIGILGRVRRNWPVLVGPYRVGRQSIVHLLAQRIARRETGTPLDDCRLFSFGVVHGSLEFPRELLAVRELGKVLLWVRDVRWLADYLATGEHLGEVAALRRAMDDGSIRCILGATPEAYRALETPALRRRGDPVPVSALSAEATLALLEAVGPEFARRHQVKFEPGALLACVERSYAAVPERPQPDRAMQMLGAMILAGSDDRDDDAVAGVLRYRLARAEETRRTALHAGDAGFVRGAGREAAEITRRLGDAHGARAAGPTPIRAEDADAGFLMLTGRPPEPAELASVTLEADRTELVKALSSLLAVQSRLLAWLAARTEPGPEPLVLGEILHDLRAAELRVARLRAGFARR